MKARIHKAAGREKWQLDPVKVLEVGAEIFESGGAVEANMLEPVYHRLSEAEVARRKRLGI